MTDQERTRPRRPGLFYRLMMGFLGLFDRWLHMSCRAFARLASERFERRLTRGERLRQALHRAMCGLCRLHERRLEQVRALAHELGRAEVAGQPTERLTPDFRERLRTAMRLAAERRGS